jgi:hypothetical protein
LIFDVELLKIVSDTAATPATVPATK